jgi:superfamily I DNA and RNA helicase
MLKRAALASVVGLCVVRGLAGCGGTALLQCKLDAVKFLPDDPMQVTPYDVVDLVGRLHACKQAGSDAGR